MLPTSTTKIGQVAAPPAQPAKKKELRNLDDAFWKEQKQAAAAILANERLPPLLALGIGIIGATPETASLRLSNGGVRDEHMPALIDALHHSECGLTELDLAFNRLTDDGVRALTGALCRKLTSAEGFQCCGFELARVHLGGNDGITVAGLDAARAALAAAGRDIALDATRTPRGARQLCVVGKVFDGSPASAAGLRTGDEIVAFGTCHTPVEPKKGFTTNPQRQYDAITYYLDVSRTVAPLLKEHVGSAVDVVVARRRRAEGADGGPEGEGGAQGEGVAPREHVQLTLVPTEWDGAGLLGCKLKELEANKGRTAAQRRPHDDCD